MAVARVSLSQFFAPALLLVAVLSVFHAARAGDVTYTIQISADGTKTSNYSNGTKVIEHKFDNGMYNITVFQNGTLTNMYNSSTSVTKNAGRVFAASVVLATVAMAFATAGILKVAM